MSGPEPKLKELSFGAETGIRVSEHRFLTVQIGVGQRNDKEKELCLLLMLCATYDCSLINTRQQ
jgi:hypothetical protein